MLDVTILVARDPGRQTSIQHWDVDVLVVGYPDDVHCPCIPALRVAPGRSLQDLIACLSWSRKVVLRQSRYPIMTIFHCYWMFATRDALHWVLGNLLVGLCETTVQKLESC